MKRREIFRFSLFPILFTFKFKIKKRTGIKANPPFPYPFNELLPKLESGKWHHIEMNFWIKPEKESILLDDIQAYIR